MPAKGVVSLLACSAPAFAHHSKAEYDQSTLVEARGEVVSVLWSNPHLRFQVSTRSIDGNPQLWEVEGEDLTRLDRGGLGRHLFEVGDVITFAGNPSTLNERRMYATHLVIENGGELLLIQPAVDVAAALRQLLDEDGRAVDTDPVLPPTATSAADEQEPSAQERPSSGDR
jgi:hypothetical protein